MRKESPLGYDHFYIVPEQKDPDPEFTTVGYPNPEDPRGFELAEKLGREVGAEVLIAAFHRLARDIVRQRHPSPLLLRPSQ